LITICASLLFHSSHAFAQAHIFAPHSTQAPGLDTNGNPMARTHLRILAPSSSRSHFGSATAQPSELPPFSGYLFETPASIACVYRLVDARVHGCNPNLTTVNPTGGSRAIAIVDAFDDPTAEADLAVFSKQFGLPTADFHVVYAQGSEPKQDPTGGWEIEESLDIEWAHAMAPNARIYLVEAASNSFTNLFSAVLTAANLVKGAGGGEVSMSWGGGEFQTERNYDALFTTPGVVYVASTGDAPGTEYPSVSPNVVAAGGTTLSRDINTGALILENTWQDAGGGPSLAEPIPPFQKTVKSVVGNTRGTPDISFDANPNSGVWIYDNNAVLGAGWYVVGGTSVSAPSLAGILNAAGSFAPSSAAENAMLYTGRGKAFNNINYGNCGLYLGTFASGGYDLCTGLGSPKTLRGK
jgi:subtilase family serine protease